MVPQFKNLWPASSAKVAEKGDYETLKGTYAGDGNKETILALKFTATQDYNGNNDSNRWQVMLGRRPMYAAGVRQNGSLVVLIGLYTASEEQMTLYYQNLFRILCGLVETALVRAFEYESVVRENWYLPDTCLLRPAVFAEQLATACTLQEDKMAHHLLLQVTGTFKNRAEFNDRVRRSIRSTDAAGVGTNNAVYLLMNQTDEENLPLLTRRLDERGLHVTAVPLDEQLRLISAAKQEASHA